MKEGRNQEEKVIQGGRKGGKQLQGVKMKREGRRQNQGILRTLEGKTLKGLKNSKTFYVSQEFPDWITSKKKTEGKLHSGGTMRTGKKKLNQDALKTPGGKKGGKLPQGVKMKRGGRRWNQGVLRTLEGKTLKGLKDSKMFYVSQEFPDWTKGKRKAEGKLHSGGTIRTSK